MAFNWQTFRTRALTAVVFAAVMLTGLLWNQWSFLVLFSVIHFGCWWEYFKLLEKIFSTRFHVYTKLGLMVMGYGLMLWFCGEWFRLGGLTVSSNFSLPLSLAGFILLIVGTFRSSTINVKAIAAAGFGLVYISMSWGMMMHMYLGETLMSATGTATVLSGPTLPLLIIASIWINDTMAYIVGSLIGRTPFSKISPKKTWEGTAGGAILCVAVMYFIPPVLFPQAFSGPVKSIVGVIAAIAAVFGTIGDLLESKLKRMADVKDSGRIMPGHGGFLDRFDSLLIAIPFVWLYIAFLDS